MPDDNDVTPDSSLDEAVETPVEEETPDVSEDEQTPTSSEPESEERTVPYSRFKQVNEELAKLRKRPVKVVNKALDVDDFIDISASLEGLDSKEKQYIAEQHKYTGKSLREIRNDENFLLWQNAYKQKVEKEKALSPSNKQSETDRPKPLIEKLKSASLEDQEKMLVERGLYKAPRPRADRTRIGGM